MSGAPPPTGPDRLLIVDDELAHLEALRASLEDCGYAITTVPSGAAALAALDAGRFDLLLTDLAMPGMDGVTLLQQALRKDPDLVGLIMTGAGTIATAVEAMKAGALDYIIKPFRRLELLPVLARAKMVRGLRLDNAALERGLRERNAELASTNRGLESFADSVANDLRAPLRAISGFVEIIRTGYSEQLPGEARQLFARVATNVGRIQRLTADLLRLSQLGTQVMDRRRVAVADLVGVVVAEVQRAHAGRAVTVRLGELPPCWADPALLRQLFADLLANAFAYTAASADPRIEVGAAAAGRDVSYHVRDNGVGFDMAKADRLFGVFQSLHGAEEFAGTGVSLSIAQRIVQRHGGKIWAESRPGEGACFSFTLPADPGDA